MTLFFALLLSIVFLVAALIWWIGRRHGLLTMPFFWLSLMILIGLAVAGYQMFGSPGLVLQHQTQRELQTETMTLIDRLKTRLEAEPNDAQGWRMLGRSYQALKQPKSAAQAFDRAYQLEQSHVPTILALAESLAEIQGGHFDLRAQALVATAYKLAPQDPATLWLYGVVSQQQGDLNASYQAWSTLRNQLDNDTEEAKTLDNILKELEKVIKSSRTS